MTRSWRILELFLQDLARLVQSRSPETERDKKKNVNNNKFLCRSVAVTIAKFSEAPKPFERTSLRYI